MKILIVQKPGAYDRVSIIEEFIKGYGEILRSRLVLVDAWRIGQHYFKYRHKSFFKPMLKYWVGSIVKIWELKLDIPIDQFRSLIGTAKATSKETFRYQLMGDRINLIKESTQVLDNGIHSSDSLEEGSREISLWFDIPPLYLPKSSLSDYQLYLQHTHSHIYQTLDDSSGFLLFSGGTLNGLQVLQLPFDLDYRLLIPNSTDSLSPLVKSRLKDSLKDKYINDIKEEIEKEFNRCKSLLPIEKGEWKERGGIEYMKGEIEFDGGKADIAVVPMKDYRYKISGSHLATLMDEAYIESARARKREASNDPIEYKRVKKAISQEIKSLWLN